MTGLSGDANLTTADGSKVGGGAGRWGSRVRAATWGLGAGGETEKQALTARQARRQNKRHMPIDGMFGNELQRG